MTYCKLNRGRSIRHCTASSGADGSRPRDAWQGLPNEEGTSENNRRAKFYELTPKGRRQLAVETSKWEKLAGAIARILRPAEQEART